MVEPRQDGAWTDRRRFLQAAAGGACAFGVAALAAGPAPARGQLAEKGLIRRRRSPWFSDLGGGALRCELCPRHCRLAPGQRGPCRVRENRGGRGYTLVHGNPALVQIDPVERKPFFHVLPGSRALSVSTAGCNIACKFCEVWDMALVRPEEVHAYDLPADEIVAQAREARVQSVSYAFGEPVVFFEYMLETAERAREAGLRNLLHTNGIIARPPLDALIPRLDAVNVDLKGFDPAFYREVCGGELEPVLATLRRLREAEVHVEVTHVVIPTLNDRADLQRRMFEWIRRELGPDTPLHLARFYPLYQLANLPPTPVALLDRARAAALEAGLRHVYVAKVPGHEGENTFCPGCGEKVIARLGFVVEEVRLRDGACPTCGRAIPGRWA